MHLKVAKDQATSNLIAALPDAVNSSNVQVATPHLNINVCIEWFAYKFYERTA